MRGGAATIRVGSEEEEPSQGKRPQLGAGGRKTYSYIDFDHGPPLCNARM